MATKKKATKKLTTKKSELLLPDDTYTSVEPKSTLSFFRENKNRTPMIVGALTIILLVALALSKGYILVALVDNKPIFRFQLDQTMMSRFGKQTLEGMISERLIADEAKKAGVVITQTEIDAQEEEVLKSFGGKVTLDELLQFQGTTKEEFDSQIKLQLTVNKLLAKDVVITDEEIAAYQETNSAVLVSTDEAGMKEEARTALTEQKINEKIQPWFTELKNKSKIFKFF